MANDKLIDIEDLTKVFYTDEVETHALADVQWTDDNGLALWQGNSAVTGKQRQYASAWHLQRAYSRFGEFVSYGYNGFDRDSVAKGWLRVSQRALDPARSRASATCLCRCRRATRSGGEPSRGRMNGSTYSSRAA